MYISMYVCMYVCMYVSVYLSIYLSIYYIYYIMYIYIVCAGARREALLEKNIFYTGSLIEAAAAVR
jgi:hypothetical protein